MTHGEAIDGTPTAPDPEADDEAVSDPGESGTPAKSDDEDLQSPPLDVDELPAH